MIVWKKVKKDYFKGRAENAFNSKEWLSIISSRLKKNFKVKGNNDYLDQFITSSPLPFLLINDKKKEIKISDFGGGSQEIFFLISKTQLKTKVIIDSVEVENLVNFFKLKKFNKKNITIEFYKNFKFNKKYDYVHISDSLQYLKDWKNFLNKLNKKKHKFIILNNVPCGLNKTYLTKQRFYNKEIPNTFFSIRDIKKNLDNYNLIFKSLFLNKIRGKYTSYPQENFKFKDRINHPKTLIFKVK
tara:strand:+ start:249 stop:977 length:729 start_codon:yes stop_codon:yes gene_type:complete